MRQGTPGFVGARLRQGREARGVTAVALAEIIGVTRAAMSQYEHGHQSPSPETMRRICQALNLPMQWFLRPIVSSDNERPKFYRCMAAATKGARLRAEVRLGWLKDIVATIQQYIRMPRVELPTFDVPSDPARISNEMIEEWATDARRFWGLKDGPISNMVWLLENRGCIVTRVDLHAATLDAFSHLDNRPYVVLGSHKASAARSRFDAAHELAHLLLHRNVPQEALTQTATFDLIENQAHRFAGAFLLPLDTFGNDLYPTLDNFRSLKEQWRVSISAMIMRSADLGLVNEKQVKKLMINLGRRRWKTKEPLDDELEPEQPRFLRKCFEVLVEKRVVPAIEIPLINGIPPFDVEELAGLSPDFINQSEASVTLDKEIDADNETATPRIIQFPFRKEAK